MKHVNIFLVFGLGFLLVSAAVTCRSKAGSSSAYPFLDPDLTLEERTADAISTAAANSRLCWKRSHRDLSEKKTSTPP